MKLSLLSSLCLISFVACVTSCKEKGPLEKAGENLDKAAESVSDAVNPDGPVEKAGKKIDSALGN